MATTVTKTAFNREGAKQKALNAIPAKKRAKATWTITTQTKKFFGRTIITYVCTVTYN